MVLVFNKLAFCIVALYLFSPPQIPPRVPLSSLPVSQSLSAGRRAFYVSWLRLASHVTWGEPWLVCPGPACLPGRAPDQQKGVWSGSHLFSGPSLFWTGSQGGAGGSARQLFSPILPGPGPRRAARSLPPGGRAHFPEPGILAGATRVGRLGQCIGVVGRPVWLSCLPGFLSLPLARGLVP